jgi:serine/threonine protein kinase
MGVVYLARNRQMDRLEVLKVMGRELLEQPGAKERFEREIRSAARLSHPHVVTAYSVLPLENLLVFAMEYVEGEDLAKIVKTSGPLPVVNACYYAQQVALGLQHAFEKKMVHRDIKPQNLIRAREGKKHVIKILDFGLAKANREKATQHDLTGEGRMLGTPDYIAPEQILDAAKADIRADIYSLGCTLYYLLAGSTPFKGKSLFEILQAHQIQQAKPLNLVRPEVPEELTAAVGKMMAKDPAKRYQTPVEVAQALVPFIKTGQKVPPAKSANLDLSQGVATAKEAGAKRTQPHQPVVPGAKNPGQFPSSDVLATQNEPSVARDTLIEASATATEPRKGPATSIRPSSGTGRKWLLVVATATCLMLISLIGLWAAGVLQFKVTTKDGVIVLENLPENAVVLLDGEKVTLKASNGNDVEISVAPGKKHQLQISRNGFKAFVKEVEIDAGDRQPIRVYLEALPRAPAPVPRGQQKAPARKPAPPRQAPPRPPPSRGAAKSGVPKTAAVPPPAPAKRIERFVPIFNGKDLTGWTVYPRGTGSWRVNNGILTVSGPTSHLFSERTDYKNFCFRVEARVSDHGASSQYFRAEFGPGFPKGYEARVDSTHRDPKSGSLGGFSESATVAKMLVKPDEWFTQEVIADGPHIIIKVNGETTVDFIDEKNTYAQGRLALQQRDQDSVVQFRKIEVAELPP